MPAISSDGRETLLLRAVNWLGDAVMTTPALRALRAASPSRRLVLVAKPPVAELFRNHPDVDDIVVYDKTGRHRGAAGLFRMAREIRAFSPDKAILFQNAIEAAVLAFLARIPERAGYATDGRGFLLTRAVPITPGVLALHHVEYYLRLLRELGVPTPAQPALCLRVTQEEQEAMRGRLLAEGIDPARPILAVNPGATYGPAKRWYPDRFAAAADALCDEWGAAAVIVGSEEEKDLAGRLGAAMRRRAVNFAGRTSVRELMALLSQCRFLLTNDSGPMHIAAALGVPLVAIFGPTDREKTSPWTHHARVVRVDVDCSPCRLRECDRGHACMAGVTVDMVVAAARDLISEVRRGD